MWVNGVDFLYESVQSSYPARWITTLLPKPIRPWQRFDQKVPAAHVRLQQLQQRFRIHGGRVNGQRMWQKTRALRQSGQPFAVARLPALADCLSPWFRRIWAMCGRGHVEVAYGTGLWCTVV